MTKDDLKKGQRLSPRNLKTGTEVSVSRIVVFKPSASLKQRINRHGLATIRGYFRSGH
jgi:integration host factor subunit alpha